MLHLMLSMPAAGSDFLAWSCQTSGKQQVWKYAITMGGAGRRTLLGRHPRYESGTGKVVLSPSL